MIRPRLFRAAALATAFTLGLALPTRAAEPADEKPEVPSKIRDAGTRKTAPEVAPASDEALQALKRMKLAPGLQAALWAAEPMLANPVAFNFDERGRIFVAETYRYRTSVLDIRDYLGMLEEDLACRTLEDRTALIERRFGPAGVKELSLEGEVVRLLEDRGHTGKADFSTIYADGFRTPLDGIGSGVLARRGQVWFTNIPSVWRFTGENRAEARTELSRGYGVRFNYTGHDLHGLVFGPDGKIYYSIGDRGAHVPTKEGGLIDAPDTGAVFRCNPDGTQLELFATGLRNPQSLLFNEQGDLFTGDNDCDQGDEERLVHVVEGGDSGWRVGYQFPPLEKDSPWLREKMWTPRHAGQAAYLLAPICNIEDGPSGIAYYPGAGLNPGYAGSIFITHFKGGIARSGIFTYNLKPSGASYAIADCKPFLTNALPTDVKFGPDGRLYYSDWAEGWPKSQRGRIYAIAPASDEALAKADVELTKQTQQLIGGDWTKHHSDELARLLGHADWRVRLEAQFTLAERGETSLATLATVATKTDAPPLARRHAIWGLGQLAAKNPAALAPLRMLLRDPDAEVRAQAIKLLGDHRAADQADAFIAALNDNSNRVKFFAAQSLGKLKHAAAAPALLAALRANNDKDNYLRHACVMGLVGGHNLAALTAAIADDSRAIRLGVLLALRRLGRPEVAQFLGDSDPFLVREAALAINDAPIAAALPALAALLEKPVTDEALMLRVLNAHFRLGQPANAAALAAYAARADAPGKLRAEALAQIALWPQPPPRDRLVGVYRPLAEKTRDRAVAVKALTPALAGLLDATTPEPVHAAALAAVEALEIKGAADTLFAVVGDAQQPGATRAAALRALDKLKDSRLAAAVKLAGESDQSVLRLAALPLAARLSPDAAAPMLADFVAHGNVGEQKAAFKALGSLQHSAADTLLAGQLRLLAAGKVAPAVRLELLEAAAQRPAPAVRDLLAQHDAALAQSGDPVAPFSVALAGGDKQSGRKLFTDHPVLACVRCHQVAGEGGEAGPDLSEVGAKYPREYLLESIVKPNAKIAPGFDTIVVTLKSGGAHAGVVASEDAGTLTLRATDNKLAEVRKPDIARREGAPSSMPEIYGTILTKSDLRDVVEYLASLKSKSDQKIGDTKPRALRHLGE